MTECFTTSKNLEINFKFQSRKYDTKHLLVIFSGFSSEDNVYYDFENSLRDYPGNVLWIRDYFYGNYSYYLCYQDKIDLEDGVIELIHKLMSQLEIDERHVTLGGFSKGGAAAIYYGIKYNFRNILATVPQMAVGSYVKKNWPKVSRHMFTKESTEKKLDRLIISELMSDKNLNKNIYILSSFKDEQFFSEIEPNLKYFIKYSNFNLIISKSILVREHKDVTANNVPFILSIFYQLSYGAVPKFGYTELIGDEVSESRSNKSLSPFVRLSKMNIKDAKLFVEGVAVILGVDCQNFRDITTKLILKSDDNLIEFVLAKDHKPRLTRDLYDGDLVIYDKGFFCTKGYNGIDLSLVPDGSYMLSVEIMCKKTTRSSVLRMGSVLPKSDSSLFTISSRDEQVLLCIEASKTKLSQLQSTQSI